MILDATTKKLQVVLAGAITSAQLQVNVSWADTASGSTFVPGSNSALTNSATPVDIVPAPAAASTQRQVKEVTVQNTDTVAATVTVQTVDGADTRKNIVVTIQSGETLFFAAGSWGVLATNGAIKGSAGVSSVALIMPGVIFNASVPGSPITTTGTLAPTLATQTANTLLAGPTTGAAATPTFRTVVAADLNSLAFTTGSMLFGNASGGISQNNAKLFWDNTNFRAIIGGNSGSYAANTGLVILVAGNTTVPSLANNAALRVISETTARSVQVESYGTSTGPGFNAFAARGTAAVPTACLLNDAIGQNSFIGYDGGTIRVTSSFTCIANENWAAGTNAGSDFQIRTTAPGLIVRSTKLQVFGTGQTQLSGALCDGSYSYQTPLTGATITPGDTVETLICEPAGLIAALTVNTPAAPKDGQRFRFTCAQAVTALTIQANAGQTLRGGIAAVAYVADTGYGWQYRLANTTWYRINQ